MKPRWTAKFGALAFVAVLMAPTTGYSTVVDYIDGALYSAVNGIDDYYSAGAVDPSDPRHLGFQTYSEVVGDPHADPLPGIGNNAWVQSKFGDPWNGVLDNQNSTDVGLAMAEWFDKTLEYRPLSSCGGCLPEELGKSDWFGITIRPEDNVNFIGVHFGSGFVAYMFDPNVPLSYFAIKGLDAGVSNIYAYDWPPTVIPLPAALPLYGTGLAVIGFIGWRKKRKAARQA